MDALQTELARPEYAGLDDAAAADAINARTVAVRRPVPTWSVRQAAIEGGFWASLVEARGSDSPQVRALAISTLAWIDDQSGTIQTIDLDRPSVAAMLTGLVAAGIATQEQADAVRALSDAVIPWTQSVGLPEVGIGTWLILGALRLVIMRMPVPNKEILFAALAADLTGQASVQVAALMAAQGVLWLACHGLAWVVALIIDKSDNEPLHVSGNRP